MAAIQSVDVAGGKLPPARFFDTLRPYFSNFPSTAKSLSLQDIAGEPISADLAPVGWAPPTFTSATPAQKPIPSQAVPENDLSSEKGVDYHKLHDLLKAGKWKEADQETDRRMLEAVGRSENDRIRPAEVLSFPSADLRTIDALWVNCSEGKWGFSVQRRIYVECGAKLDGNYPGNKIWHEFCRRVGWRKRNAYVSYSSLTYDLKNSPPGEFPAICGLAYGEVEGGTGWWVWFFLISHKDL
ncbi:GUN4 domain-containing protein [Leptolyngbya sp. CCNP1308]|uniref:GUN4 domain-containing protein n=1 Tax=Leptolyngbya sp. CCNP1308 TaxID=3110255 RepID=UPI002B1F6A5C|nr:GUN4 domain-containing protein [Leptolyngbya sp. CCNP1308]MEA5447736.1 GUN4 domain-containing protein [Leptolyngbya sp. CCNP1308]